MTLLEAIDRYGQIIDFKWENEGQWCSLLQIPEELGALWVNSSSGNSTYKIYCNKDIQGPLLAALLNIKNRGIIDQLKSFDGCFNLRDVRGEPGRPSAHCYGIAIDINASTNALGTDGDISDELAKCFIDVGFKWGKDFKRKDPQHFTLGW